MSAAVYIAMQVASGSDAVARCGHTARNGILGNAPRPRCVEAARVQQVTSDNQHAHLELVTL